MHRVMDFREQKLQLFLGLCLQLVIADNAQNNLTNYGFVITSRRSSGVREFNHFTAITTPMLDIENTTLVGPGIKLYEPNITPLSCDTDYARAELYYYDYSFRQIGLVENFNLTMDLTSMNVSVFQGSVGEDWSFVAVDWVSHNVYWVDGMLGQIFMKKGGKNDDNTAYKTVVSNLGRPRGLAVDPLAGYLFWTDTTRDTIMRASLVGKDVRVIVYPGQSRVPSSIALDMVSRTIYWTDRYLNKYSRQNINSISYDGKDRRSLFRDSDATFYDIILFENTLIATDIGGWNIYFIDPSTGRKVAVKEGRSTEDHYGLCSFVKMPEPVSVPTGMCESYGCQHICVIQPNEVEPTCLCHDGYTLKDKKTCEASGYPYHRGIVLNTGTKLFIANINILSDHKDETPTCFYTAPANKTISWFDLDMKQRLVYFSINNFIYSVKIDHINQTADMILEQTTDVLGLTYDWTDRLLYYALDTVPESGMTQTIWQADPSTGETILSKPETVDTPSAIAVSPYDRKVFWVSSGDDDYDQIKYTDLSMETGNVTVLETTYSLEHVTHIYHHVDSETLFLLDKTGYGKDLIQMEYDGNYTDYPVPLDDDIVDFAVYESYILMAIHTEGNSDTTLKSADIRYTPLDAITTGKLIGLGRIVGIKVLDRNLLQPDYPNPCGKAVDADNGGCEQICLPDATGEMAECHCTLGFDLVNGTECMSDVVTDNFILISDVSYNSIFQIPIGDGSDSTTVIGVKTPDLGSPTGIAYDDRKGAVITTNKDFGDIISVYLNGTLDFRISNLAYAYPDRFAIDPHSGLIYQSAISVFADYYYDSYIGVIDEKGRQNILYEGAHFPRAIAIHPGKGWLFFTDTGDIPGIYRIDMDGGNYKEIVTEDTTDIMEPYGLTIDYKGNRLYWTDAYYDTIKSVDLDDLAVREVLMDKGSRPMGISYVNGFIYYSAWNNIQIKRFPVSDPKNITYFGPGHSLGGIVDMAVYMSAFTSTDNIPENLGCSVDNGGCSSFCLPNSTGFSCGCTYYYELLMDDKTCDDVPRCPLFLLTAKVEESSDCVRVEGNVCPFTCIPNYTPKEGVTNVTCTPDLHPEFDDELLWDDNDPCREIFCPKDLANAELNMTTCDRKVGGDCGDYTCMTGYERNEAVTSLVCQESGQWEMSGPLCIAKCPVLTSKDDKAVVHPSCNRDINDNCRLICDDGYKSSVSRITCLPGSRWSLTDDTSCKEVLCEDYFDGGSIEPACTRKLRVSCGYNCDTGLQPNPLVGVRNLTCMDNGMWSHGGPEMVSFCTVVPVNSEQRTNEVALGVGMGSGLLILLLFLLVIFLYRSGRLVVSKSRPPVTITSFENPRYTGDGVHIEGSQVESSMAYSKLDEETGPIPRKENVYDDLPGTHS